MCLSGFRFAGHGAQRQLSRGPVLNRPLEEKSPEGGSCFLCRGDSMRHVMRSWCVWYAQGRPTSPPRRAWRAREWEKRKDGRLMKEVNKQNLTDDHFNTILIYFCTFISLFYGHNTYSLYKSDSLRLSLLQAKCGNLLKLEFTTPSSWVNTGLNFS